MTSSLRVAQAAAEYPEISRTSIEVQIKGLSTDAHWREIFRLILLWCGCDFSIRALLRRAGRNND